MTTALLTVCGHQLQEDGMFLFSFVEHVETFSRTAELNR